MNHKILSLAVLLPALSSVSFGNIILSHDFTGAPANDLDGTSADTYDTTAAELPSSAGSDEWAASTRFKADGTVNAETVGDFDSAWLSFVPEAGKQYKLTADFDVTVGSGHWISVGFATDSNAATTGLSDRFQGSNVDGIGTFLAQDGGVVASYSGVGTSGQNIGALADSPVTVEITLDTTPINDADWTVSWAATDTSSGVYNRGATKAASGNFANIKFVGFTVTDTAGGSLNSLELAVVPEPSQFAAILSGGLLALLLTVRRGRQRG